MFLLSGTRATACLETVTGFYVCSSKHFDCLDCCSDVISLRLGAG